ncbi:MAG TPA: hypothetical protein VH370_01710 [Humisphaera sp.]|nr:hypothetical protein [Humisphaera sp.]
MKWIGRNKLNLTAIIAALLLAALLIRSFWRHDRVECYSSTHLANSQWVGDVYQFQSLHGVLSFEHLRVDWLPGHSPPPGYRNVSLGPSWHVDPVRTQRMASPDETPFGVRHLSSSTADDTDRWTYFIMPHWLAMVLLLIWPTISLTRYLMYGPRFEVGHCPTCGYDLRASPGRCPECGAAPATT